MVGVRRCGRERWRVSCEGVGRCKNTGMREEISRDNQDTIRQTWLHDPIGSLGGERLNKILRRGLIIVLRYYYRS